MPVETPRISIIFGIESNTAFFVACFVLMCALAWAIRDHRRRQLEMATAEQEDHLYLSVLSVLFIGMRSVKERFSNLCLLAVCTMGAYYAFRRSTGQRLLNVYGQPMEEQIQAEIADKLRAYLPDNLRDRDDKDLFYMALAAIFVSVLGVGGYFVYMRKASCSQTQFPDDTVANVGNGPP